MRNIICLFLTLFISVNIYAQIIQARATIIDGSVVIQAEDPDIFDEARVDDITYQTSKIGVFIKSNAVDNVNVSGTEPDLVFSVQAKNRGRYEILTYATVDDHGAQLMQQAHGKDNSIFLKIEVVGDNNIKIPSKRVVFVPWSVKEEGFVPYRSVLGKFDFNGSEQKIRIWLPKGIILDFIKISTYTPPKVPEAVVNYEPKIIPPVSRPRLWVNANSLPIVRANLTVGENKAIWDSVRIKADKTYAFNVPAGTEVPYDVNLENAIRKKAFVYLMTGDKNPGREAVNLTRNYLSAVEFGNLLDITREIGRAIYSASLVYDWCYDLMSEEDKECIRSNLMRLADDMEVGWPPFRLPIVIGHASEQIINQNLLSMSIAIYDEDPIPYQYISYRILEELVPMRQFEYQSPRHNQGTAYGPYRFMGDMYAASLFYRMAGQPAFDENIKEVYKSFFYHRLPDGKTFPYGDGSAQNNPRNYKILSLLCSAYNNDPLIKGHLLENGLLNNELSLLLNNPNLIAINLEESEQGLKSLPLTRCTGKHLGSMTARTGWDMTPNSSDVVVDMMGGGYRVENHQHADAGSFQIFYRGRQVVDLGQYHFYGTPYDKNFTKRSISHSMMLAVDPDEKFRDPFTNDGGNRGRVGSPTSLTELLENDSFRNGEVISGNFGPNEQEPLFSYFSIDLTSAYSDKIEKYVRSFTFLNLKDEETPAMLIVLDNMTTSNALFKKYWQINTLNSPTLDADNNVTLTKSIREDTPTGKVTVKMLRPKLGDLKLEVLSGDDSRSVFGSDPFPAPVPSAPEANGTRIMYAPKSANNNDVFLTVFTMSDTNAPELLVNMVELSKAFMLAIGDDRLVVLNKTQELLNEPIGNIVIQGNNRSLLVTGLTPGIWKITSNDGAVQHDATVIGDKNTAYFNNLPFGKQYSVKPDGSH